MGNKAGQQHGLVGAHHLAYDVIDVVVRIVFIIGYLALKVVLHDLIEHTSARILGTATHGGVGEVRLQHEIIWMLGQHPAGTTNCELYAARMTNAQIRFLELPIDEYVEQKT